MTTVRMFISGRPAEPLSFNLVTSVYDLAARFSAVIRRVDNDPIVDAPCEVIAGGSRIFFGRVDDVSTANGRSSPRTTVTGRDIMADVIDTGAQYKIRGSVDILGLVKDLVTPLPVTLSNADNRPLLLGRGRRPRPGVEPVFTRAKDLGWQSFVGAKRGDVLRYFLSRAGLLAWASRDGGVVVAKPNHGQESSYRLVPLRHTYKRSTGDRHSHITGFRSPAGLFAQTLQSTVADDSGDFQRRKESFTLLRSARNGRELRDQLAVAMARERQTADTLETTHPGLGLPRGVGEDPVLFAIDTVGTFRLEGQTQSRYIAGVTMDWSRARTRTVLRSLPLQTEIVA